jgi:hypothetical protein
MVSAYRYSLEMINFKHETPHHLKPSLIDYITAPCLLYIQMVIRFAPVARLARNHSLQSLKTDFFEKQIPVAIPSGCFPALPAIAKWFETTTRPGVLQLRDSYFVEIDDFHVEVERTSVDEPASFDRFTAPMSLFRSWTTQPRNLNPTAAAQQLYIAQTPLDSLPDSLRDDVPTPEAVSRLGRGHVYASSLWMGKAPTNTPLHRDPNPNFFVQLAGPKRFRLLTPEIGHLVVAHVKRKLSYTQNSGNFMTQDMMSGDYRRAIDDIIWSPSPGQFTSEEVQLEGIDAQLRPGDGIIVPLGWWHAVRGEGKGINASVKTTSFHSSQHIETDEPCDRSTGGSASLMLWSSSLPAWWCACTCTA